MEYLGIHRKQRSVTLLGNIYHAKVGVREWSVHSSRILGFENFRQLFSPRSQPSSVFLQFSQQQWLVLVSNWHPEALTLHMPTSMFPSMFCPFLYKLDIFYLD